MTWNIIGCGETAALWDGHGLSIGVNDCEKTGKKVAALVVINPPHEFQGDRLLTIKRTKAKVYCDDYSGKQWKGRLFCEQNGDFKIGRLVLHPWRGKISERLPLVYHADTSPFVAMSLAYHWKATEIVLWGVDFTTHSKFQPGQPFFANEIRKYVEYAGELRRRHVKVWLGAHGSALEPMIPVKPA